VQLLIPRLDYHLLLESKHAGKPAALADLLGIQSVCAACLQLSGVGGMLCRWIGGEHHLSVAANIALVRSPPPPLLTDCYLVVMVFFPGGD
jgi:hypothetical protein